MLFMRTIPSDVSKRQWLVNKSITIENIEKYPETRVFFYYVRIVMSAQNLLSTPLVNGLFVFCVCVHARVYIFSFY